MGQDPDRVREVTSWVMEVAKIPVWAKMTPNITDIRVPARAAVEGGDQIDLPLVVHLEGTPLGLPLLGFINGLDRERADLEGALASLAELDQKPVQISLPIGSNSSLSPGITAGSPPAIFTVAAGAREPATDPAPSSRRSPG